MSESECERNVERRPRSNRERSTKKKSSKQHNTTEKTGVCLSGFRITREREEHCYFSLFSIRLRELFDKFVITFVYF